MSIFISILLVLAAALIAFTTVRLTTKPVQIHVPETVYSAITAQLLERLIADGEGTYQLTEYIDEYNLDVKARMGKTFKGYSWMPEHMYPVPDYAFWCEVEQWRLYDGEDDDYFCDFEPERIEELVKHN